MKEIKGVQTEMKECEISNIWEVLGRQWTLLILKNLCNREAIRFNELKRALPGISRMLLIKASRIAPEKSSLNA
jgi:DNA-binding HxlR family transcriptional regulator